jgi:thioredoxin
VIIVTLSLSQHYLFCKKKEIMATIQLTTEDFKNKVFDYTKNNEWKFEGDKPAMIDFYADWCGPCKMVAPILEELANEYGDKINIYKVDTEAEQELSAVFGIRSIPSMLFIPMADQPKMQAGALPKNVLKEIIDKELLATA